VLIILENRRRIKAEDFVEIIVLSNPEYKSILNAKSLGVNVLTPMSEENPPLIVKSSRREYSKVSIINSGII